MILAVVGGLADVYTIAQAQGLSLVQAYELFSFYSVEGQITGRGRRMADGEYSPLWTLEMADKDARLMQAAAKGAPLPVVDAVEAAMHERIAEQLLLDTDPGAEDADSHRITHPSRLLQAAQGRTAEDQAR